MTVSSPCFQLLNLLCCRTRRIIEKIYFYITFVCFSCFFVVLPSSIKGREFEIRRARQQFVAKTRSSAGCKCSTRGSPQYATNTRYCIYCYLNVVRMDFHYYHSLVSVAQGTTGNSQNSNTVPQNERVNRQQFIGMENGLPPESSQNYVAHGRTTNQSSPTIRYTFHYMLHR